MDQDQIVTINIYRINRVKTRFLMFLGNFPKTLVGLHRVFGIGFCVVVG